MSAPTIEAIRASFAAITPGPWMWHGNTKHPGHPPKLCTNYGGRIFIMNVNRRDTRTGRGVKQGTIRFQQYQPGHKRDGGGIMRDTEEIVFPDHNGEYWKIPNPDAEFIAASPDYVGVLLAEIDRLVAEAPPKDMLDGSRIESIAWVAEVDAHTELLAALAKAAATRDLDKAEFSSAECSRVFGDVLSERNKLNRLLDLVRREIAEHEGDSNRSASAGFQAIEEGFYELGYTL